LIAEAPDGFEVYSGDDWATFGYVCLGAVGVVSVASHLVGPQIRQMIELIETGDVPAARKRHEELSPLFNALFVTSNPIPLKAALEMVGRGCGEPRLPLVPVTAEEREWVRRALEDAGLLS
jgi:4-hydroxy-tetrahydrodipicolinate synthase